MSEKKLPIKKVNKIFTTITVSIIILVSIAILGTYMNEYLSSINWFGDHDPFINAYGKPEIVWGPRHYWYNWGTALLLITSFLRAVVKVIMIIEEK